MAAVMLVTVTGSFAEELKKTVVPFTNLGFSAEFPSPFTRQILPSSEDTPFAGAITAPNGVYLVMVKKTPADTIVSTFIEQAVQSDIKSAAIGSTKRWELESRQGVFVKGLTRPVRDDIASLDPVKKFLNGRTGIQSFALMPLKDDRSPALLIGIVAPVESQRDAENEIRGLATFMKFARLTPVAGSASTTPATPPGPAVTTGPKPPVTPPVGPKITPAARPVTPGPGTTAPATGAATTPKPATPKVAPPAPVGPKVTPTESKPEPVKPVAVKPAPKPVAATPAPKPNVAAPKTTKPVVAKPKPEPKPKPEVAVKLKVGEIEIMGTVQSISADKKSIQVSADKIRMPGQNVIAITPRSKTIQLKNLPANLKIGSAVSVTGKNKGVGSILIADRLSVK